ncbi:Ig-like domain-containing protein [Neisseria leonii]|uniref:Ig-like domain-containing protein n=1 Tax=Neisseria leonii TaxID=2995413 RepID=UPI0030CCE091
MSKNITLKVNSAKETLDTLQFNTAGNQAVRVKAQPNVNYELTDEATGFGPENIMTRRSGNDLHIAFEGSDIAEPDLIIEGYYDQDNTNLLIGRHENGNFYPYVPESGQTADAVSMLADHVAAGQALGGNPVTSPLWVFNPLWLLALLPIAGAIAAISGGSGDKAAPKTAAPTVTVTSTDTDGDGNPDKTTISGKTDPDADVTITLPNGDTITTKADKDGNYSVDTPTPLKDGDKVTVVAKAPGKEASDPTEGTVPALPDTTADSPDVVANDDGSVTVTPGKDNVTNKVDYIDEDGNDQTITATKQPDGTWTATDKDGNPIPTAPDANNPSKPWIDPTTGKITLPPEAVKDGSDVNATATDGNGNTANDKDTAKDDPKNAKVIFEDKDGDGNNDNIVTETPKNEGETLKTTIKLDNNNGVENLVIGINSPDNGGVNGDDFDLTNVTFTNGVTSNGDGTVNVPAGVTEFDVIVPIKADQSTEGNETGKISVGNPTDGTVVDGNEFTITDTSTTPAQPQPQPKAEQPTVTPSDDDGSVKVTPGNGNNGGTINYTGEDDSDNTITTKKGDDGQWTATDKDGNELPTAPDTNNPNKPWIDPTTGVVTIPQDAVKDGSDVTAKGTEEGKTESDPATDTAGNDSTPVQPQPQPKAEQPTVTPSDNDGSVTVTPGNGNNGGTINYTGEDDSDNTITTKKGDDGQWTATDKDGNELPTAPDTNNPNKPWIDPTTGVVTIPQDSVKDGSDVTAKGTEEGKTESDPATGTAGNDSNTPAEKAEQPTVTPSTDDGSVTVTPGNGNNGGTINYTGEDDSDNTITTKKGDDGQWTATDKDGNQLPTAPDTNNPNKPWIDPTTGVVTIPQDAVKDGSDVTAKGTEEGKTESDPATDTAGTDSKNATVDNSNNDGVVTTSVNEGEVQVTTVKLTNNNGTDTLTLDDVVGTASADDFDTLEFSDGVTVDATTGLIKVPAGVTEFTISMRTVEDNTTEGDETIKFTIGGVEGNEATIKDTSTTPAEPVRIASLDLTDNLTDEDDPNRLPINGSTEASGYYEGGVSKYIGQIANASGDTALSRDTGLTNDPNITLIVNLEKPLAAGQTLEVIRYTMVNGQRTNPEDVSGKLTSTDQQEFLLKDDLAKTFGTDYQYEVIAKTNGNEDAKQTYDFRLDTEVEAMEVTKANFQNGNAEIELTARGNSEKGATIYGVWESGGTTQFAQFTETNGVYTANLQGFSHKNASGLQIITVDAAGNILTQKTNFIRNLFSEYNDQLGPDTTANSILGTGGYDDDARIAARQGVAGSPNGVVTTDGNDALIIGLDQFGGMGMLNGSLSDEGGVANPRVNKINTGAGDDFILVRGVYQGFEKDSEIEMGAGNDKFQVNHAVLGSVANPKLRLNMGEGNNIINLKEYVGSTIQSFITSGDGNDTMLVGSNWDGVKTANFGHGDNILNVGGYIANNGNVLASTIDFGNGNDQFITGGHVDDRNLTVNMGDGDNYIEVGGKLVGGKIISGSGDDVAVLGGMGATHKLSSDTADTQLVMGAGNDTVTLTGASVRGLVDMGDGDDTLSVNTITNSPNADALRFDGGAGNDTIILTGGDETYTMALIKNFEVVDMKATATKQILNVKIADILENDNVTELYIKGGAEDVVNLGNGNSTDVNLNDRLNGNDVVWTKMDASQKTVDGITYDAYTVSTSTEWVYIQQGVQVV